MASCGGFSVPVVHPVDERRTCLLGERAEVAHLLLDEVEAAGQQGPPTES